jgi:hypothetical protein
VGTAGVARENARALGRAWRLLGSKRWSLQAAIAATAPPQPVRDCIRSPPVGAENLRHLAGCSADRSVRRLPGRGMICVLWA